MVEKRKRKHLPPRGDPAGKSHPAKDALPERAPLIEKEEFGENTFAGALEAVKGVLEKASAAPLTSAVKQVRKKG
jgi:hypothetical protein